MSTRIKPLHFFTVASNSNHHLDRLLTSCKAHNIDITVLGLGKPYGGNGTKINLLTEALSQLDPDDLFLFVDAYDLIFLTGESEIKEKYMQHYYPKLVFGAEQNFGMYTYNDIYYYLKYPIKRGGPRFLNTGTIMGKAGDACALYKKIGLELNLKSDQKLTIPYFVQNPEGITVDQTHELFAVNGGRAGLEEQDYQVKDGRLYATRTQNWPVLFHVPGKFFMGLDKIAKELGYMSELPSYTPQELARYKSESRDHRICNWLGVDNYPYRLVKNWTINFVVLWLLFVLVRWGYVTVKEIL